MLFDVARSKPQWKPAFYAALAAANTTTRGVELKHLKIGDVNLIDGEIVVRRSKTDAGLRKIRIECRRPMGICAPARTRERAWDPGPARPLPFSARALPTKDGRPARNRLRSQAATEDVAHRVARPREGDGSGSWTCRSEGSHRAGRGWRAARLAWKRAAGGLRGLRFHDLRHCAVTKLAESQSVRRNNYEHQRPHGQGDARIVQPRSIGCPTCRRRWNAFLRP